MSTHLPFRLLSALWLALFVVLPGAAQDTLLQPAEVRSHPAGSLPVANLSSGFLFAMPDALLADGALWSFDGSVLRVQTAEAATGLLTVSSEKNGTQAFQFYTATPDLAWSLRHARLLPPDTPGPVFTVGAAGQVAYVLPATATLVLLGAQGEVVQETALFKDAPYTLERTVLLATQPRTGNVLVAAMRQSSHLADGGEQAVLFCYDPWGALLWKVELLLPSVHALSVDPQGRFIAVASVAVSGSHAPVFRTLLLDAE
ncbi:MAG TPA: hypothetical protein VKP65_18095, partial [Rhodothermales bacterium]|nr:hypothetical protein [Rhodothermales bacterium]